MTAGDADTVVVSATMIHKMLYYAVGCFAKSLTQSVYESVFQSVLRFSHVRIKDLYNFNMASGLAKSKIGLLTSEGISFIYMLKRK